MAPFTFFFLLSCKLNRFMGIMKFKRAFPVAYIEDFHHIFLCFHHIAKTDLFLKVPP